jgi:outer membrane receptor protein involved in Fe transport
MLAPGVRGLLNRSYQHSHRADHQPMSYMPRHKTNLSLFATLPNRLSAYVSAHFVGPSLAIGDGATQRIDGYTRVDARLGYKLGRADRAWDLSLSVTNLLGGGHLESPATKERGEPSLAVPQPRMFWLTVGGNL